MRAPEFWRQDGVLAALLSPLGTLYDLAGRWRAAAARPAEVGAPVICVGNLVAGGAGKTPVTVALLELLTARGRAAHGLTRGYGGSLAGPLRVDAGRHTSAEVGDEALLISRVAPTWLARDRVAGARAAVAGGADVIVMDDGFQDPSLAKRLPLLVVDGAYGFGNARVIPAGPLREPIARGLARAAAVVVLEDDTGDADRHLGILGTRRPILRARLVPRADAPDLKGRRVVAFAGIGRPEKFFATVAALGADIVDRQGFADHHRYHRAEVAGLIAKADSRGAVAVTTEKDHVRLPSDLSGKIVSLPVAVEWREPREIESLLAASIGLDPAKGLSGAARRHGTA